MKKGEFGFVGRLFLSLAIMSVIGFIVLPYFFGEGNLQGQTIDFITDKGKGINGSLTTGDMECLDDDNEARNKRLIREEVESTQIPPDLMVAIAAQESRLRHCSNGYVVESRPGSDKNSVGVLQINLRTAESACPNLDVWRLEDNIKCVVKVLQQKYEQVTTGDTYENAVNEYCDPQRNPDANERYMSYEGDPWKMAVRAYNGFGCNEGADVDYVENVFDRRG